MAFNESLPGGKHAKQRGGRREQLPQRWEGLETAEAHRMHVQHAGGGGAASGGGDRRAAAAGRGVLYMAAGTWLLLLAAVVTAVARGWAASRRTGRGSGAGTSRLPARRGNGSTGLLG